MLNNSFIFNSALSGTVAGASQRWVTSQTDSDYTAMVEAACAFATELDSVLTVWDPDAATSDMIAVVTAICQGFWTTRFPTSQISSDYTNEAKAIAALIRRTTECMVPTP